MRHVHRPHFCIFPVSLDAIHQAIVDQGLTEDLGVRPAAVPGQVILYALEGASSWPYECVIDDEPVDFDITQFLSLVARDGQDIQAYENAQVVVVSVGDAALND